MVNLKNQFNYHANSRNAAEIVYEMESNEKNLKELFEKRENDSDISLVDKQRWRLNAGNHYLLH